MVLAVLLLILNRLEVVASNDEKQQSQQQQQQQLLLAYYSGVGGATVGPGGLNGLSLAFFSPGPMGQGTCDFASNSTPCVRPAAGAGSQLGLAWIIETISTTHTAMS